MVMPTLSEIATLLNVPCPPNGTQAIAGVNTLAHAGSTDISFLGSIHYMSDFLKTRAAAVLVQKNLRLPPVPHAIALTVDDADLAVSKVLELLQPAQPRPAPGIHGAAHVATSAEVEPTAAIGPNVFIGERAKVGRNCAVHANVYIGDDVTIGDDCQFFPGVVIRERIAVGNRVIIHAGSVLGTDGFGYRWDGKQHAKIPQIGTVIIEDDVEIGSCVCIDRGKFSSTRVGRGTKIDNHVQIAHNCIIGPFCIIAGMAGLAGSVTVGAGVVIAGQAGVKDHVTIGDRAVLAAQCGVWRDVGPKQTVQGQPAQDISAWAREEAALRHLPDLFARVRKLQNELEDLKKSPIKQQA
jgi:UDP-3-O-[3-hydroxymyristoyl] glucosamine N-acyltransferase